MASGTIECVVKSVDYGGGTGHVTMKSFFNWNVTGSTLTVTYDHSESISGSAQTWVICGVTDDYGIYAKAEYSTDGGDTWTDIMEAPVVTVAICPDTTNVYNTMQTCFEQFSPATLSNSGLLRITYGANYEPAPIPELPNAFPSYVQTESHQVPIVIEIDYRPGAIKTSSTWRSHNNDGGACHKLTNGSWVEMKTSDAGATTNNPPQIRRNNGWQNMERIGS